MKIVKRMAIRKTLIAVAVLCAPGLAHAQDIEMTKDTLTLTLDKALGIALAENPTMKVAAEEIALKKVANKEAWQNLLPEASLAASVDHTVKAAEMKLNDMSFKMGQDGTNTANAGLTVNLPLFAPAIYKTMSITRTDIELAVEKSRESELELVNQVCKAFYQLMLAQDSYEVLTEGYLLAVENFDIVSAKYEQGSVSEFDKISAEVQMLSIRPNVLSAQNAVTLAKLQLRVLMGITADVELKLDDSLTNYETMVFAHRMLDAETRLENNSTMRQLELNLKLLDQNISALKTNFMPTLSMSFSYQYQSLYNPNINFFNYNWSGSSHLMFNLSIPLFRASNFTQVKKARIQRQQLDWNRVDTERKLNLQLTSFRNSMQVSSQQLSSNKENVMQARKAMVIAGKRYDVGKGTMLEVNNSQLLLTQAELAYNQSIYDYLVAKADLEKVLGKEAADR
ncbi:MAG: TolC family protein [Mediterranea sp.]|jgi:outer membrane protein TolC|nr:TolC family protein [Mediterranea sp.]